MHDRGDTNKFFIRVNEKKFWGTATSVDANVELGRFSDRPPWMGIELRGVVLEGERIHGKFGSITIYRQTGQMRFSGEGRGPVTLRIQSEQGDTVLRGMRRVSYDLLAP